jgi:imidazoleglycerol-phosphate dehydratase
MNSPQRRVGAIERKTKETEIRVEVDLDGQGRFEGSLGIPFFEHMLDLLARHGQLDLKIEGKGDLEVDSHHTVEDAGICLGEALAQAVGEKRGINRFGDARVPMEEALAEVVLDFCNRSHLHFDTPLKRERLGGFDVETTEDFFRALSANAGLTLHVHVRYGRNEHHIIEAIFKAFARALAQAVSIDPRRADQTPSTKGVL